MTKTVEESQKTSGKRRKTIPQKSIEARENQLINLAYSLAEKKLRDGTASSQIITTLLNMRTQKTQLEVEKLRSDLKVAQAKIDNMKSQETSAQLYENAMAAFKRYSGIDEEEDIYDEDYD